MKPFSALLDALIAAPAARKPAIEELIRETFEARKAVLALDMSGFTLSVRRDGILSYLCQVRRMQKLTKPIVYAHEGDVVKYEADNLLAVFDDPVQAVKAAVAMDRAAAAEPAANGPRINFSIGIDYGEILFLEGTDCFGDAVNLSHKLGEDIARAGEILVTPTVRERLGGESPYGLQETPVSFSGIELIAFAVTYAKSE